MTLTSTQERSEAGTSTPMTPCGLCFWLACGELIRSSTEQAVRDACLAATSLLVPRWPDTGSQSSTRRGHAVPRTTEWKGPDSFNWWGEN